MAQQISDLSIRVNSLDAAFRSGQMSQLSGSVTSLEAQSRKHEKQLESVSSGLESVQNQLADFQEEHSKLTGSINKLSSEALARRTAIDEHSERIDDINSRLSQVESRVAGLSKAESNTSQKESKQNQQPVTKSKTSSKSGTGQIVKKPERSVRRAAVEAPFVLTGIERRGGQMFAVVIPRGNSQISDMRLLSPGDGMLGWTLRSIQDSGTAVFSVNGAQQSLQVQ
ncbi:plasmid transfer protein [Citrobacter freundii]|nr:plasmid transfer protein [Cronobacter sakazakii]